MAETHCFIGTREVGKPKLRTTSSGASTASSVASTSRKSPQRISDILRLRRLRLNRAKTTASNSLSDSLSESANNALLIHQRGVANRTNSNSLMSTSSDLYRNNSTHSYQSARSTRSNMTAMTTLSSRSGKSRRLSRYEDEPSDGQLGINEKELNSMNKHIPALKSHGKSATFRQHYYPEGGWGWVICFCCFLVNIFTTGLQLSFSILYLKILQHCESEVGPEDKISIVWIGSTNLAVSHLLTPFLVALCRRKSIRLTAVVGGLIMSLSLLFASFAKHFNQIFLSYGFMCGIGCAMVRDTSGLMLGQYFKRRREIVEFLSTMGIGFGIAIFSNVYHMGLGTLGWRLGLQTVTGSAVSLFFLGLFYRSASLYHPQRRAILHLKDMSKRKGKDKNKIESKPPYFDFNTLSMRSFQVILVASALASTGTLAPVFFLVPVALEEGLNVDQAIWLQTYLGIASALGAFLFGIVSLSKSQQCMISRQYLLQASIFGIGVSMLALVSVQGYHGYLLFVWMYGLFMGGHEVALRVYCYERLKIKQFARGWGFVQGIRGIPYLVGLPITAYIGQGMSNAKTGFYFSFSFCILGGCVLFLISLIEHLKGTYGPEYYGGSKLELCKTDTNMTFEMNGGPSLPSGGHFRGCAGVGESASALFGEPPDGQIVLMPAPNGHLKCTCLPSSASLMEDKMRDVEEVSAALAEVSTASHHSKLQFNDEIQVVEEEENEEDEAVEEEDMIDLAQALYAAGVRPEPLFSISEENLCREEPEQAQIVLSDEDTASASGLHDDIVVDMDDAEEANKPYYWSEVGPEANAILYDDPEFNSQPQQPPSPPPNQQLLVKSQSEPDLVHLLNEEEKRPHPSSRPLITEAARSPVKRQKTWHPIQSIKRSNGIAGGSSTPPTPSASPSPGPPEELTSFV